MKKLFLALCSLAVLELQAQNVGIGTTTPNANAILELNSSSKALLLPRLTAAQRNAIANPAAGMLIYNIDSNRFEGCVSTSAPAGYTQQDSSLNFSGISYPCCVNGYVQYNPTTSFLLRKIQLLLSNSTGSPQTLQINFGDFGGNPIMGTASAVVPANTTTAIPVDFIFSSNISVVQSTSYAIRVAVDNQNIQWRGTTGSPFTNICGNSGFNIGLAYRTFSYIDPGLVDEAANYSGISYPCCVNGYVQYNPSVSFGLAKVVLQLSNNTASPQTLQINIGDFAGNPVLGTASAVVPPNSTTPTPIEFVFATPINLTQFASYAIRVAVDNQNIQWRGTTGSAFTNICGNSGFNIGLAYRTYNNPPPAFGWVPLH